MNAHDRAGYRCAPAGRPGESATRTMGNSIPIAGVILITTDFGLPLIAHPLFFHEGWRTVSLG